MASPEFSIIELLRRRCRPGDADVRVGIGDDAAVTAIAPGMELVTATDSLVEGTHFVPGTAAHAIGHKVLAVNLSDFAAMGAEPRWASIALAVPDADMAWVGAFADGFAGLAAEFDVALIGGDTVRGPLSITVTLQGTVPAGGAVRRDGAQAGDAVFVSGDPGYAAAGCRARQGTLGMAGSGPYLRAFEYPQPRVALGQRLRELATAMIDVSDGVHTDLTRLLESSGCGADLDLPPLGRLDDDFGTELATELFLSGGEDYELCFTVAADRLGDAEAIAADAGIKLCRLGTVTTRPGARWTQAGQPMSVSAGFEHFGSRP